MSSDLKPIHPEVMYAERSSTTEPEKVGFDINVKELLLIIFFIIWSFYIKQNVIYFTISAPDIKGEPELEIKPKSIHFSAKSGE
jgi:hypothetical protein